uniref:hypothetical protein n=1 Tax=Flexistipes sinusarabici TaxID=2352 RepID=UPI0023554316
MSRVGSIGYQVREMLNQVNGIGTSKMAARNESGLKAENGHKVSDKVHSAKSLDNLKDDLNNLGQYAKAEHNIKDMSQITKDVIEAWINSKDIKYDTASNYLSELNKVSDFMSYTRADIKEIRTELKETLERTKIQDMSSRAYKNADKIEVPDKYKPALELQRDHGLRSSAARTIDLDKQLKGNTLSFKEKGGKEGQRELSPSLVSKLKENAVNGKY